MDDDQLFLFADETVDHLEAALGRVKTVKEIARGLLQGQHLDQETRKKLRVLVRDAATSIYDAETSIEAAKGELP